MSCWYLNNFYLKVLLIRNSFSFVEIQQQKNVWNKWILVIWLVVKVWVLVPQRNVWVKRPSRPISITIKDCKYCTVVPVGKQPWGHNSFKERKEEEGLKKEHIYQSSYSWQSIFLRAMSHHQQSQHLWVDNTLTQKDNHETTK